MDRLKTFRNTALALACTLLAFSCSNEDDSGTLPAGDYPMTFSGSVEQQLTRSSSANSWDGGEEVAIETGGTIKKYTAVADGKLTAASGVEPFYWQTQTETKTVEAWYPYSSDTPNSWSVKADQSTGGYQQSDFLYAPATNIPFSARNTTQLKFYHQTAKVVINIKDGNAVTDPVAITSVKIGDADNLALSGGYTGPVGTNVTVGTWSNLSNMGFIIPKEQVATGTNLKSYAALVIPQDMASKKFVAVTLSNGNTYYYTPATGDANLEGGNQYTYDITVKNTGITVSVGDFDEWEGTTDLPTEGVGSVYYKVGDYYPYPNVDLNNPTEKTKIKGVVYWVDPTSGGKHGKVVGLQEASIIKWSDAYGYTNARDMANGRVNMKTIYNINNTFSGYPAFAWVHSLNSGSEDYSDANATGVWYLPAKEELGDDNTNSLYVAYNNYEKNEFNTKLTAAGGIRLSSVYYWSSSERIGSTMSAWYVGFYDGDTDWDGKTGNVRVRCVLAF